MRCTVRFSTTNRKRRYNRTTISIHVVIVCYRLCVVQMLYTRFIPDITYLSDYLFALLHACGRRAGVEQGSRSKAPTTVYVRLRCTNSVRILRDNEGVELPAENHPLHMRSLLDTTIAETRYKQCILLRRIGGTIYRYYEV